MRYLIIKACLAIVLFTFFSCADNKKENETTESEKSQTVSDGSVNYTCPMHPDVIGKKGDKCPKCGMELILQEAKDNNVNYRMNFSIKTPPVAGEQVEIQLKPTAGSGKTNKVELSIQHEKKIHLIVVSDDLSWFDHIHPEETSDGNYSVNEVFPAGGTYHFFADYKPVDGIPVVDTFSVRVDGKKNTAKSFNNNKLTGQSGDFSFELQPSTSPIKTGSTVYLTGIVRKNGKEIDAKTLDNYLGAKAHIVNISVNDKMYHHIHPTIGKGRFDLEARFDKPGVYRWWIQFMSEGKLYTIDMVTKVEEGLIDNKDSDKNDHRGHNH